MATAGLRDIVTEDEYEAVMALRRGAGREGYLGTMMSHFEDAVAAAVACPRYWSVHDGDRLVGYVMISDGIPQDVLDANDDIVGPYYLWRLLIDRRHQFKGYGGDTLDAIATYVRIRPGGDVLLTSCRGGEGSPMAFYLGDGFVKTCRIADGEEVLALDLGPGSGPNGGPG